MHLIGEVLKKTGGKTDAAAMIAAAKGMAWESPRGPISIDPETRDIIQNVYIRRTEKVGGEVKNVLFDTIPNVKDPVKAAMKCEEVAVGRISEAFPCSARKRATRPATRRRFRNHRRAGAFALARLTHRVPHARPSPRSAPITSAVCCARAALKDARAKFAKGEIDAAALTAVEDREIDALIEKQEAVGLQSITDGEFRRSWWHLDFLWGLDGVEKLELGEGVAFAGMKTRAEGVQVTGRIGFTSHPHIEHFKYLAARTKKTAKVTIPAPSALYGRPIEHPDRPQDLSRQREDVRRPRRTPTARPCAAFADAGCRYLQLDEVFIAMLCDPKVSPADDGPRRRSRASSARSTAISSITAMSDIPADMTITMHLCRGNYRSTWQGAGGYEAVQEILFNRINVHGYFMEYDSERAGGFEPLRLLPKGKKVVLGLVTTKTGTAGSQGRDQAAHRGSREVRRPSTSSACRRSAASPPPRKAIRWPRTSSGRNCA